MKRIEIIQLKNKNVALLVSDEIILNNAQDAVDIMADCSYNGSGHIILGEENIAPEFFDLKTGLAGEILQKFSNYKVRIAIVGDFSKYQKKSFRDFVFESNKRGHVNFVASFDEAIERFRN